MEEQIVNKVANSSLEVFDLEDFFPQETLVSIDISQWLLEGFILKEKDFRTTLKEMDWSVYQDKGIVLYCSTDAILPAWTFALVSTYLLPYAKQIIEGSTQDYILHHYIKTLNQIDYSVYLNKPLILKGCSKKAVPQSVYTLAIQKLAPFAKSIMFGEACSAVPLFKSK
ncbi:DUF2480 family protein [Flavobacterium sp. J27]|uniref:DUF2480 family protein n=1 Tax=Flavobacterium sp. J27 TaxID=2060419 RepID=UPI0010307198|nr:DUF2480 family protein [Flavobacterium sp. J27]